MFEMKEKKVIEITVEGGLITWIEGIPDNIKVIVRDYDVNDEEDENYTDENGDKCHRFEW